jgi:hypothetical protein
MQQTKKLEPQLKTWHNISAQTKSYGGLSYGS